MDNIKNLPDDEQAEQIADKFGQISQEYDELKNDGIKIPNSKVEEFSQFNEDEIKNILLQMDAKKSSVKGDVRAQLFKHFGAELDKPETDVKNCCLKQGIWPSIYKLEIVTPVPKIYLPKTIDDLRNISSLLNLDKVAEKLITKLIIGSLTIC